MPHHGMIRRREGQQRRCSAFSLIELLVVISIIALLIGILLPALGSAREVARAIDCASRLRQLSFAAEIYAEENHDFFPERAPNDNRRWPERFRRTYQSFDMLVCPSDPKPTSAASFDPTDPDADADGAHRSYMFNGWDDFKHTPATWTEAAQTVIRRADIKEASNQAFMGEKDNTQPNDSFWVDIFSADEYARIEQSRHGNTGEANNGNGYSNYAFADMSVRTLRFGESLSPVRLWALRPEYRDHP